MSDFKEVAIGVCIKDQRLLMARWSPLKNIPLAGLWHLPGGKVEEKEPMYAAIKREWQEELAYHVEPVSVIGSQPWMSAKGGGWWHRYFIHVEPWENESPRIMDVRDVDSVQWMTLAEAYPHLQLMEVPDAVIAFIYKTLYEREAAKSGNAVVRVPGELRAE